MSSIVQNLWASPCLAWNSDYKIKPSRAYTRCLASSSSRDSTLQSSDSVTVNDSVRVNGVSSVENKPLIDVGNGHLRKEIVQDKLEPLWDDGYGTQTVKDYLELAEEIIKPDGGPPRWFTPISAGPPLRNSPLLLFLPVQCVGMDGTGLGLVLHEKALGKVFQVWCLHIPVYDRTPFEELVKFVETTVRMLHASSPNKPIYVVGDSFGGCLALAVAARNCNIDLVLILANPATSFGRSQLQPLLSPLESLPDELHVTVPYLLSFIMGDPMKMAMVNIDSMLPPQQVVEQLFDNLTALLPRLSYRFGDENANISDHPYFPYNLVFTNWLQKWCQDNE
uniref:Acyltransferase-like protein At1g54570, chloroplastic isoform X1 n=1 Tax=Nicotiana tabacum TaxID=4097 RepID=A0A1S4ARA1_TOBAC|nr:PREDICTED: acyltransferase-like protein At1g54570, chloroplastic isoform X1 [Nicotiana tabacum]